MKIGMITDSLADLSVDELVRTSAELGIERLEFAGGNWSRAPHLKLDRMLESESERREFLARLRDHGIALSASDHGVRKDVVIFPGHLVEDESCRRLCHGKRCHASTSVMVECRPSRES